jgi:antitoxin HicB
LATTATIFGAGRRRIETALMGRIAERERSGRASPAGISRYAGDRRQIALLGRDSVGKAALAKRLGWHLPQIDRLLDLNHASKLDAIEAALAAMGRNLEIKVMKAA